MTKETIELNLDNLVNKFSGEYKTSFKSLLETPYFLQDYVTDYNEDRYYHPERRNEYDVLVEFKPDGIYLALEGDNSQFMTISKCLSEAIWSKFSAVHAAQEKYPIAEEDFLEEIVNIISKEDFIFSQE